jgi:hypothetical protein
MRIVGGDVRDLAGAENEQCVDHPASTPFAVVACTMLAGHLWDSTRRPLLLPPVLIARTATGPTDALSPVQPIVGVVTARIVRQRHPPWDQESGRVRSIHAPRNGGGFQDDEGIAIT